MPCNDQVHAAGAWELDFRSEVIARSRATPCSRRISEWVRHSAQVSTTYQMAHDAANTFDRNDPEQRRRRTSQPRIARTARIRRENIPSRDHVPRQSHAKYGRPEELVLIRVFRAIRGQTRRLNPRDARGSQRSRKQIDAIDRIARATFQRAAAVCGPTSSWRHSGK